MGTLTVYEQLQRKPGMRPEPEPAPDTPLRVYHKLNRTYQEITYAEWPGYRDTGWRQLAPQENPDTLPKAPEPKPGLSLPVPSVTGNGSGIAAYQRAEIRKELYRVTTALAPRVQAEPLSWERFAGKEKAPVADAYAMTILAQVVERLAAQLDELQAAEKGGR